MSKDNGKRLNAAALVSTAVAGVIIWSKRDLAKGIMQLKKSADGFVKVKDEPETYLTRANDAAQAALFTHLEQSTRWHLADNIADGYFWLNEAEEVLLLTQSSTIMGKYWLWQASRQFD